MRLQILILLCVFNFSAALRNRWSSSVRLETSPVPESDGPGSFFEKAVARFQEHALPFRDDTLMLLAGVAVIVIVLLVSATVWWSSLKHSALATDCTQGENEDLDDELLQRARYAQEIGRARMAKFMEKVAERAKATAAKVGSKFSPKAPQYVGSPDSVGEIVYASPPGTPIAAARGRALSSATSSSPESPFAILIGADMASPPSPATRAPPSCPAPDDPSLPPKRTLAKKPKPDRVLFRNSSGSHGSTSTQYGAAM